MYTKFHDNTIETKFIKQLVATTNVPFISTWRDGQFAVRGMFYIYGDSIWRCNHTGYPAHINDKCEIRPDQVKLIKEVLDDSSIQSRPNNILGFTSGSLSSNKQHDTYVPYFTKIKPYTFGEEYYGITGRYSSKTLGYDATTHFYLGQYLRMLRDLYDLNLMSMYNCYCGETIADVDFDDTGKAYARKHPDMYKIMSVPVKFGKTYTIAMNSELPVEMILVVYGDKGLIRDKTDNLNDIVSLDSNGGKKSTYQRFLRLSFLRPTIIQTKDWHQLYKSYFVGKYGKLLPYDLDNEDSYKMINDTTYDLALGQYERYLRLLIKVPKTNTSSLVVLEGDYGVGLTQMMSNSDSVTFSNMSGIDTTVNSKTVTGEWIRPSYIHNAYENKIADTIVNLNSYNDGDQLLLEFALDKLKNTNIELKSTMLLSPLGLLQLSDGNNYAFSNRLIEYLLQHAINHLESFDKNIERILTYARSSINMDKNQRRYTGSVTAGVWDENLRKFLFDLSNDTIFIDKKVDLTGYVDKDVESVITRGLGV